MTENKPGDDPHHPVRVLPSARVSDASYTPGEITDDSDVGLDPQLALLAIKNQKRTPVIIAEPGPVERGAVVVCEAAVATLSDALAAVDVELAPRGFYALSYQELAGRILDALDERARAGGEAVR